MTRRNESNVFKFYDIQYYVSFQFRCPSYQRGVCIFALCKLFFPLGYSSSQKHFAFMITCSLKKMAAKVLRLKTTFIHLKQSKCMARSANKKCLSWNLASLWSSIQTTSAIQRDQLRTLHHTAVMLAIDDDDDGGGDDDDDQIPPAQSWTSSSLLCWLLHWSDRCRDP